MDFSQARTSASQKHLNLFGGPDENAERARVYAEAKNQYPVDPAISDCTHLKSQSNALKLVIDAAYQSKTLKDSSGNQRVQNRIIDGYTKYKNEVDAMYVSAQCDKKFEDLEEKEFFDTQYENLERVQGLTKGASNTTKYLVFGMLGIIVIVSGVIIFKK